MLDAIIKTFGDKLLDIVRLLGGWVDAHAVNIVAILIGAWLVRRFVGKFISRLLAHTIPTHLYPTKTDREKRIRTLDSLGHAFLRIGVSIIAAILIVGEINPAYTTALFASAGLIGVAIGFGAQSLIRDFVSGIFIITENQYRIGDEVTLSAGAGIGFVEGTVEDLTIRTTVLRDLDGNVHHMPNGNIGYTTNKTIGFSRINEEIAVSGTANLERLEHIINHVGEQLAAKTDLQHIIIEAPYFASVKGFTGDGVIIKILAKTTPAEQWRVRSELYKALHKAFQKNDIKLAGQPDDEAN